MTSALSSLDHVPVGRRPSVARRQAGSARRTDSGAVAEDRRQGGRRKVPRRRQIDPTTCERDYSPEEIEFMQAMDAYKCHSGRMFPTCSEILEVIRTLGYVRPTATPEVARAPESPATPTVEPLPAAITSEGVPATAYSFDLPA